MTRWPLAAPAPGTAVRPAATGEADRRRRRPPLPTVLTMPAPASPHAGRLSQQPRMHRASVAHGGTARVSALRGGGRATALDSLGLPCERIAVLGDEDQDRTPKPLVATRPHGSMEAAWGEEMGHATATGGDLIPPTPACLADLEGWPEVPDVQQHCRSKATQCPVAAHASRGIQVLSWELRAASYGTATDGSLPAVLPAADGAVSGGEEEDALLAMQQHSLAGAQWPGRPPPESRRSSVAAAAEWRDSLDLGSQRTSYAGFGPDGRPSMTSSRAGAYPALASGPASGGRASILSSSAGHGQQRRGTGVPPAAPPALQLSPSEALAREVQRQKAAEERALARMPGLLGKLQAMERAVLFSTQQHAMLAQFHGVKLCTAAASCPDAGVATASGDSAQAAPPATPALPTTSSPADRSPVAAASISGGSSGGSVASLGSTRPQAPLPLLWSWHSELSGALPVSCLAFNRCSPGLLAVGYGRLEHSLEGTGLLAVWSTANPVHPLWHAVTPCGVSALDWSGTAPGCLAVGFFDGGLALYDTSAGGSGSAQPLECVPPAGHGGNTGGHAGPVWRLRFVPRGGSDPGEEMLVSASTDGLLLDWKQAQGLERSELLRLKRPQCDGQRSGEGLLGRAAGLTCFAFSPADPRSYLVGSLRSSGAGASCCTPYACAELAAPLPRVLQVGTEEGAVHRCSTAFGEQSVQTYSGHLGPVYKVGLEGWRAGLFRRPGGMGPQEVASRAAHHLP